MSVISNLLNSIFLQVGQTASPGYLVYWPKIGSNDSGKPLYGPAVQKQMLWFDVQKEILLPDKRKVVSQAMLLLSEAVTVGSLVWQGQMQGLSDWQAASFYPSIPSNLQGGQEIIKVSTTTSPFPAFSGQVFMAYL